MDTSSFQALVHRLERHAAEHPAAYKVRVGTLALLGYGYVFGMLVALLLAVVLLAWVMIATRATLAFKVLIPLLVVLAAVLRALWVKIPAPQGLLLEAHQAPKLFELVQSVRRRLRAPPVDVVVIDADLNAAMVQVPRLGMLGWHRNYLLIGLPLLQAVPPQEWRAILAHEMGHLSGNHDRFGSWIYRLRQMWARLLAALEAQESALGKAIFGRFLKRYAPYFNAYSFVLARAHEYEADAASAEVAGPEATRRALARLETVGRLVREKFWPTLYSRAANDSEPPRDPYRQLREALRRGPAGEDGHRWLAEAWRRPTDFADTHPALAGRLAALGWQPDPAGPDLPPPGALDGPSAAQEYLGEVERALELELDHYWLRSVHDSWRERHESLQRAREQLDSLEARVDGGLAPEEEWERITLCSELGEAERADRLAEALLARVPGHHGARFLVGQALLRRGDARGIEHIEEVMRRDPAGLMPGCKVLFDHHWANGDRETAERYRRMAEEHEEVLQAARAERLSLDASALLQPHDLSAEQVAALREQLPRFPEVGQAYLARRVVQLLPDHPCYVLGIVPRGSWWRTRNRSEEIRLANLIATDVHAPFEFYVFLLVDRLRPLRRELEGLPGARLL